MSVIKLRNRSCGPNTLCDILLTAGPGHLLTVSIEASHESQDSSQNDGWFFYEASKELTVFVVFLEPARSIQMTNLARDRDVRSRYWRPLKDIVEQRDDR
ncbi:unnamed protein product [Haemonchus placei]|uniref:SH2 domain-containing protein n=1 Tax=Haemonchus placei TaxID=6290 RepID=A0A0N4WQR5_HAEPC|nr:unnamed protein product [Haemonchus placei]